MKKSISLSFGLLLVALLSLTHCGQSLPPPAPNPGPKSIEGLEGGLPYALETDDHEIKITAYNVENLFDAVHDEGKEDYTFLPKGYPGKAEYCRSLNVPSYRRECEDTDWTQEKLNMRLGLLAQAISRQGSLPDLLAVEEIENANVARQLAGALGYAHFAISNSPDVRGIDNALFYKTEKLRPLGQAEEIELRGRLFETGKTRNILRMKFSVVNGPRDAVIEVFVNHWPSQGSPTEKRMAAATALRDAIQAESEKLGERYYPIAVGDFNTLVNERPNPFDDLIESQTAWPFAMWDAEKASYRLGNPLRPEMPEHSYYYDRDRDWSKLDRILLGPNWAIAKSHDSPRAMSGLVDTFRYIADPSLLERRRDGTQGPSGFDPTFKNKRTVRQQGYSDHLQVVMNLKIR